MINFMSIFLRAGIKATLIFECRILVWWRAEPRACVLDRGIFLLSSTKAICFIGPEWDKGPVPVSQMSIWNYFIVSKYII